MIRKLEERFRFAKDDKPHEGIDFFECDGDSEVRVEGASRRAADIEIGKRCEIFDEQGAGACGDGAQWVNVLRIKTPEFTLVMDHEIHLLCLATASLMFSVGTAQPDSEHGDKLVFAEYFDKPGLEDAWADAYKALAKLRKWQAELNGDARFSHACGRIWQHIYAYVRECGGKVHHNSLGRCYARDRLALQLARDRENPEMVPHESPSRLRPPGDLPSDSGNSAIESTDGAPERVWCTWHSDKVFWIDARVHEVEQHHDAFMRDKHKCVQHEYIRHDAHAKAIESAKRDAAMNAGERVKNQAAKALEAIGVTIIPGPGFSAALVATFKAAKTAWTMPPGTRSEKPSEDE